MIAMSIIIVRAIISTSGTTTPTAIAAVEVPGELAVEKKKIKGLCKFVSSCVHRHAATWWIQAKLRISVPMLY